MTVDNKILLVKPFLKKSFHSQDIYPPTSLGYLAHVLDCERINYDVFDMGLGHSNKELFKKIEEYKPTHVGISIFTYHYKSVYDIINKIKLRLPKVKIVAGGPHISTFREKVLQECESVDYGVILEGEFTLAKLMKDQSPNTIKGLIYRDNDKIIVNDDIELTEELDKIGFPKYSKFEIERYTALPKLMTIVTTRGCPHQCIYCPVGTTIGRTLRYRSPEHIIEEIRYWYDKGYKIIEIMDDNFTFKKDRVHKICDLIEAEKFDGLVFNIPNGVRADKVDYDLLKRLKEVGFKKISFGVEAGNDRILKILKKGEKIEVIKQAIDWAVNIGFEVSLFFLIGSPGETYRDFEDSLKIAEKYAVSGAYFYNIIPYPRTELYDWISKNGYFLKQPEFYLNSVSGLANDPIFETPEMALDERKKAYRIAKNLGEKAYKNKIKAKLSDFGVFSNILTWSYCLKPIQLMMRKSAWFRRFLFGLKTKLKV